MLIVKLDRFTFISIIITTCWSNPFRIKLLLWFKINSIISIHNFGYCFSAFTVHPINYTNSVCSVVFCYIFRGGFTSIATVTIVPLAGKQPSRIWMNRLYESTKLQAFTTTKRTVCIFRVHQTLDINESSLSKWIIIFRLSARPTRVEPRLHGGQHFRLYCLKGNVC